MKKSLLRGIAVVMLLLSLLCVGCAGLSQTDEETATQPTAETTVVKADAGNINDMHLRDNDALYSVYDDSGVVTMYLTVTRGNSSENTDHSWSEINSYSVYDYEAMGIQRYQVNGLLQVGDENGPVVGELGYGDSAPNATVQIRGQSSSRNAQKNYKIELKKNKGTWRGQRSVALNKHQSDGLRFRNKLAYDLIEGIDQMVGLRTQFVHLYVKDLTDSDDAVFEDYGLYTQVEQLNKTALKAHGLDSNGHLYKVEYFEFYRYEDVIKLADDPDYDQTAFEEYLEIKGDSDHSKLIEMLEALNDVSKPMDEILDKYFDTENIAYWLAFQLLLGNTDTNTRNMYLYSPLNSDTWYILDWDNDSMLMRTENELDDYVESQSWQRGVSNYWGNVLFRRCLQNVDFCAELESAIEELYAYFTDGRIKEMTEHYRSIVEQYIWEMPDVENEPLTKAEYELVASNLTQEIRDNYELYTDSWNYPMPFFIATPQLANGVLRLNWDLAYDFDAEDIRYTVELATDYAFQNVIFRQEDLVLPEAQTTAPEAGQYFVRVRATNSSGYTQDAFDYYVIDSGKVYGTKCFYIQPDGSIVEDVNDEG